MIVTNTGSRVFSSAGIYNYNTMPNQTILFPDNPMWQAYDDAILAEVRKTDVFKNGYDPEEYHFSVGSTVLFLDVANKNDGIANASIFELGNRIPAWSEEYIPQGDFFTSYWLFINYAILGQANPVFPELSKANPRLPDILASQRLDTGNKFLISFKMLRHSLLRAVGLAVNTPLEILTKAASDCQTAASTDGPSDLNMPVVFSTGTVSSFVPLFSLPGIREIYAKWQAIPLDQAPAVTINLMEPNNSFLANIPNQSFLSPKIISLASQTGAMQDTHITATFSAFEVVLIQPGDWYKANLINDFKSTLPGNAPPFFGKDGSLSLLPKYAIFAYQPTIQITSESEQTHRTWMTHFSQNPSAHAVGPFLLDPGLNFSNLTIDMSNLTISSMAIGEDMPALLGVLSKKIG